MLATRRDPEKKLCGLYNCRTGGRLDVLAIELRNAVLRGTVAGTPCVH